MPLKAFDQKVCLQRRGFCSSCPVLWGDLGKMAKSYMLSVFLASLLAVCNSLPNLPAHPQVSTSLSSQGVFATAFMEVHGKGGIPQPVFRHLD